MMTREPAQPADVQEPLGALTRTLVLCLVAAGGCGRVPDPPGGASREARIRPDEHSRRPHGGEQTVASLPGSEPDDFPLRVYEPLFPGDGEYRGLGWNDIWEEPGESFEAYISGYKWGTAIRSIRIYPLGPTTKRIRSAMVFMKEFLEIAFSSSVEVMDPLGKPTGAYNSHFDQYDANSVLNGMLFDDGIDRSHHLNIAVTETDMYAGRLNFVFGYADYVSHVGIVSLARLGGKKEPELFERRLLKLSRHEIGHMYGMAHCTSHSCVMRGANSRSEADSISLSLCPSCAAKLAYRLGDDGSERNKDLERYYRDHFGKFIESMLVSPILRGD